MIDSLDSFYNNLNMLYMTLMMVAPMWHMFPSKAANVALLIGSLVIFAGSFTLIRMQTTIGDTAFLRSMIPHHSAAISRCFFSNEGSSVLARNISESRDEAEQLRRTI